MNSHGQANVECQSDLLLVDFDLSDEVILLFLTDLTLSKRGSQCAPKTVNKKLN
jgi:hypothetical protein